MMSFSEYNKPAKALILHYAEQLGSDLAREVVSGETNLSGGDEAKSLACFFWEMVDQAVEDENSNKTIEGVCDLQTWLEKALNIFTGYFKQQGYEKEWSEGYDRYHSQ